MSSVNIPNPVTPPRSPMDDPEAIRQRQIASDNAIAEAKSTGRGATIIGGAMIARDEQAKRVKARAASSDLGL
jgi:hypothetical protein